MSTIPPEETRLVRARWMFEFLVDRGAWLGCRDWGSLDSKIRDSFTDMTAFAEGWTREDKGESDSE